MLAAYLELIMLGKLQAGKSVLIHAGEPSAGLCWPATWRRLHDMSWCRTCCSLASCLEHQKLWMQAHLGWGQQPFR